MERLGHKDIKTTLQTYTFNTDAVSYTHLDVYKRQVQDLVPSESTSPRAITSETLFSGLNG